MKKNNYLICLAWIACSLAVPASAKNATNTLKSTATMNATCSMSASNADFGVLDQTAVGQYGSSKNLSKIVPLTVTVLCSNKTAFTIKGTDPVGGAWFMKGADSTNTDKLAYAIGNLYLNHLNNAIFYKS